MRTLFKNFVGSFFVLFIGIGSSNLHGTALEEKDFPRLNRDVYKIIMSHLEATSLLKCRRVSKQVSELAEEMLPTRLQEASLATRNSKKHLKFLTFYGDRQAYEDLKKNIWAKYSLEQSEVADFLTFVQGAMLSPYIGNNLFYMVQSDMRQYFMGDKNAMLTDPCCRTLLLNSFKDNALNRLDPSSVDCLFWWYTNVKVHAQLKLDSFLIQAEGFQVLVSAAKRGSQESLSKILFWYNHKEEEDDKKHKKSSKEGMFLYKPSKASVENLLKTMSPQKKSLELVILEILESFFTAKKDA